MLIPVISHKPLIVMNRHIESFISIADAGVTLVDFPMIKMQHDLGLLYYDVCNMLDLKVCEKM